MQKLISRTIFSLLMAFFLSSSLVLAQKVPKLDFFHGRECPHCQEEKAWFPVLKEMYPGIEINEYEVWHDTANQKLWGERLAALDMTPSAVPTNIIGEEVVVGFSKTQILELLEKNFGAPVKAESEVEVDVSSAEGSEDDKLKLIFILLGAGILVGAALFVGQKK